MKLVKTCLREAGTHSKCYQSENFLKCLQETGMKLKACSCKHFSLHSEFSLIPTHIAFLVRHINGLSGEISDFHEENFVPIRAFRTSHFRTSHEIICVSPSTVPEMSETGPWSFLVPVSCTLKGFVLEEIWSRAGLASHRSHTNRVLS